jgi:hypothetical protein
MASTVRNRGLDIDPSVQQVVSMINRRMIVEHQTRKNSESLNAPTILIALQPLFTLDDYQGEVIVINA